MFRRCAGNWKVWLLPLGIVIVTVPFLHASGGVSGSVREPERPTTAATPVPGGVDEVEAAFPDTVSWGGHYSTSLHATAQGMKTWYGESNGGFEGFTGVPYGQLGCKSCHEPSATGGCTSCHESGQPEVGADVNASLNGVCGTCHSRQKAEAAYFSDVHRDQVTGCMMCHTREDVMGDGTAYSSMLEKGAIDARCERCHETLTENPYHVVHLETLACSACHVQSVVSCYNCHFETELHLHQKVAYGQLRNWVFLVNRNGKVHTANFQTVKHGEDTFVAIAPFYAHTIARNARECLDCHGSAAVRDYVDDGVIDVATWDEATGTLRHVEGVVPVPPDYQTALRFDFVDLDRPGGSVWSFLKSGADRAQILFGEPLTASQMDDLKMTVF